MSDICPGPCPGHELYSPHLRVIEEWWNTIAVDEFFARLREIQDRNRWIEDVKERLGLITEEDLYL